jgi:acylphosphatase
LASIRVVISGRVQGVGYRYWLAGEARRGGIRGWARNAADGSVEAVLAGDDAAVEALIARCRDGPRAAHVTGVARERAPDPGGEGFRILPDAL